MAITLRSSREIELMRQAGGIVADVLLKLKEDIFTLLKIFIIRLMFGRYKRRENCLDDRFEHDKTSFVLLINYRDY